MNHPNLQICTVLQISQWAEVTVWHHQQASGWIVFWTLTFYQMKNIWRNSNPNICYLFSLVTARGVVFETTDSMWLPSAQLHNSEQLRFRTKTMWSKTFWTSVHVFTFLFHLIRRSFQTFPYMFLSWNIVFPFWHLAWKVYMVLCGFCSWGFKMGWVHHIKKLQKVFCETWRQERMANEHPIPKQQSFMRVKLCDEQVGFYWLMCALSSSERCPVTPKKYHLRR